MADDLHLHLSKSLRPLQKHLVHRWEYVAVRDQKRYLLDDKYRCLNSTYSLRPVLLYRKLLRKCIISQYMTSLCSSDLWSYAPWFVTAKAYVWSLSDCLTLPLLLVFSNHQIIQWAILSAALVEVATAFAAAFVLLLVSLLTSATHSVSGKCSCTFRKRHILVNGEMSSKVIPSLKRFQRSQCSRQSTTPTPAGTELVPRGTGSTGSIGKDLLVDANTKDDRVMDWLLLLLPPVLKSVAPTESRSRCTNVPLFELW